MKIVIVNYWSDTNKGDCAMAIGAITALKQENPDVEITLVPSFWSKDSRFHDACTIVQREFPDVRVISTDIPMVENEILDRLMPPRVAAILSRPWWAMHVARSFLKNVRGRNETPFTRAIAEADLVLGSPGSFFFIILPGVKSLIERIVGGFYAAGYPFLLARRFNKPFALYSQTIGPFYGNRIAHYFVRKIIGGATLISAREVGSKAAAIGAGLSPDKVELYPDAAFGVVPSQPEKVQPILTRYELQPDRFMVLTVRPWYFYGEDVYQRYLDTIAEATDALLDEGVVDRVAVVLMSQLRFSGENDIDAVAEIRKRLKNNDRFVVITENLSPSEISAFCGQARLTVGTRAHSLILSSLAGTPSVGIAYAGHKTQGFMNMLGLDAYVQDIQNITTESLLDVTHQLLEDAPTLRPVLLEKTAAMKKRAYELPKQIMEASFGK